MSRRCALSVEKGVLSGNKVSHSNRKTRTRFLPNLQKFSLVSDVLGETVRLRATPNSIRSVEHNDGLDNYLLTTPDRLLSAEVRRLKRRVQQAVAQSSC